VYNSYGHAATISESYTILYGLQIQNTAENGSCVYFAATYSRAESCYLDVCNRIDGIYCNASNCKIVNCIAVRGGQRGFFISDDATSCFVYNCVAINCGTGFRFGDYRTFYVKNCYSGGNTTDYYGGSDVVWTTCYSEDGTGTTTTAACSTSSGVYFTNVTAGSEDVSISASSALNDSGTNLSSDTYYAFSTDILGTSRGTSWCVGAYEYVAAGGATKKSETDSATGTDNTKIIVRFGQTDTASGADSLFVKAIIKSSDTASGIDSNSVKAYIKPVDSGSGTDTIPLIRANFKLTDAGVNSDGERILVKTTLTDSGTYLDAINSIKAYLRIDDSGLSSDDLAIFAKLAIGETGTANDLATKGGNAYVALTDSGVGVDSISIRALLGITDSGSGADSDFAKLTLIISDSGVAVDNVSIKALLALVDSGITSDDIVSYNPSKLLQDYGSFVDSVVIVDSTLPVNHVYTVGDYSSLPVDDTDLETSFIAAQYTDIAVENNSFVDQTALDQYALFQFKEKFSDGIARPTVQCRTKSTLAPSSSTVYLQVYNRTTSAWVTLASNSSASANTVFTLSATVTGTLSDYYDASFWYSFRIYQLMQ